MTETNNYFFEMRSEIVFREPNELLGAPGAAVLAQVAGEGHADQLVGNVSVV